MISKFVCKKCICPNENQVWYDYWDWLWEVESTLYCTMNNTMEFNRYFSPPNKINLKTENSPPNGCPFKFEHIVETQKCL